MKQTCPQCHTVVEIDESIYAPGTVVKNDCPVCGETLEFVIPVPAVHVASAKEEPQQPQAPAAPVATAKEEPQQPQAPAAPAAPEKKGGALKWIIALIILLAAAGICTYFFWYVPYATDRDALRTYVYADNVFLRSSMEKEVDYNKIDKLPYGSELITYSKGYEWADVKVHKLKGYVATQYLMNASEFNLLNGIWGDNDARKTIASSKCRKALVDYYKRNNLYSGPSGWQYFSMGAKAKPNTVFYPRIFDKQSKYTDFFIVLKNNNSGQYRLVIYSFDDATEAPIFRADYDVTYYESKLIKSVKLDKSNPDKYTVTFADGYYYVLYK